ncbi:cell wall-binding repeat-containing protein [Herbiconiux sp. CPCC 203407]|uniref:Cell wall-binding repeat-containing protein n=1 Tax=Herbiconiux oxytropis TaxID=2970915 RepID=A0AA41XJJ0_9MICO|nr:cell wall-binding repeat-containing protein [Herbiconiux oxytropis]MCS5723234.1 cell wall-binding repeat-containing protein [Herbiconiux oxytropis]MCS5727889.1 cell wall-binding repeat-containing protein [Herbiconiux oxytropis]
MPEGAEPPAPSLERAASPCVTIAPSAFGSAPAARSTLTDEIPSVCFTITPQVRGNYLPAFVLDAPSQHLYYSVTSEFGTECSDDVSWSSSLEACLLAAQSTYTVEVTAYSPEQGGDFGLSLFNLSAPAGCTTTAIPSWSTDALTGQLGADVAALCFEYSVAVGTPLQLMLGSSPGEDARALQFSTTGDPGCQVTASYTAYCTTSSSGKVRVAVFAAGATAVDFGLRVQNLRSSTGCQAYGDLAFGSPAVVSADVSAGLGVECLTLDLSRLESVIINAPNADGEYHSGTWVLHGPTGDEVCSSGWTEAVTCTTSATGTHRLIFRNAEFDEHSEAVYAVAARSITDALGCESIPSLSFDALPQVGTISGLGGADCYTVPAKSGDTLRVDGGDEYEVVTRVFNKAGSELCRTRSHTDCRLSGAAPFQIIVESTSAGEFDYQLSTPRLNGASGCPALPATAFGSAPKSRATLTQADPFACFSLPSTVANTTDFFALKQLVGVGDLSYLDVIAPDGDVECSFSYWFLSKACTYRSSGTYTFAVKATTEGSLTWAVGRTPLATTEVGCTDLGSLPFNAPATRGSISAGGEVDCFTFGAKASDRISLALDSLSAGFSFSTVVIDGRGEGICSANWSSCDISGPGPFRVLVQGDDQSPAGEYELRIRKLNDPAGCTPIESVGFGFGPVEGEFTEGGQQHCYSFVGATGDQFDASISNLDLPGQEPDLIMLDPSGHTLCSLGSWVSSPSCTLPSNGSYAIVASANPSTLGAYSLQSTCVNPVCGTDGFAVASVSPSSAGVGGQVTLSVTGKALSMKDMVALQRGSASIPAVPTSVSNDRRTMLVTANLTRASIGAWDLVVTSATGAQSRVAGAFRTESIDPASVNLEIITQGRFVAGRPQTVTVTYQNVGNVDALGVPLILEGFPAGSEIVPDFDLIGWDGDTSAIHEVGWQQEGMVFSGDRGLGIPLTISSIPAGASGQLDFTVNVPATADYSLSASLSGCMFDNGPGLSASSTAPNSTRAVDWGTWGSGGCMDALVDTGLSALGLAVPGGGCLRTVVESTTLAVSRNVVQKAPPFSVGSGSEAFHSILDIAGCAVPGLDKVVGVYNLVKGAVSVGTKCFNEEATAENEWVTSLDPNEIVGPGGGGDDHATRAEGDFTYAIYFENMADATAPAQEVRITDQLDPAVFDLSTVRFGAVAFGDTRYTPAAGTTALDHVIDLRDTANVNLDVAASVDSSGVVSWDLLSLDPVTGELPQNPDQGFLPPNVDGSEGQGVVYFTVTPKSPKSKSIISNKASIVFDLNEPIVTNTWNNLVDRDLPAVSVTALPAKTVGRDVKLSWSGSDATSAVAYYDVYVAIGGGDYELWRGHLEETSATYTGVIGKKYSFVVLARDLAANGSAFPSKPHAVTTTVTSPPTTPTPTPTTPSKTTVDRIAGANRYAVAVAVSKSAFPNTAPVVYIATGANYPDALSAGPAAVKEGGPLLLTSGASLPPEVKAEVKRLKPSKIVVVGGVNSVSEAVVSELKGLQKNTVRIAGANRYEASQNLVDYAFGTSGAKTAYVATGANFPDALSAGGAGGSKGAPVILVNGKSSTVDAATKALLKKLGVTSLFVAGGPNSVSEGIRTDLASVAPTKRLSGADRYEASANVNASAYTSSARVFLATGTKFPDALAGSAWAGKVAAPLFVVPADCVPKAVLTQIKSLGATRVTLLGGPASLSSNVERLKACTF